MLIEIHLRRRHRVVVPQTNIQCFNTADGKAHAILLSTLLCNNKTPTKSRPAVTLMQVGGLVYGR